MDIVYRISEFIDPNPVAFSRFAAVNKDFYSVFTSDKVWAQLDVYDIKEGIYKDYLEKTHYYHGISEYFWTHSPQEPYEFDIESVENKYIQLGYYLHHTGSYSTPADQQTMKKLLEIRSSKVSHGPTFDPNITWEPLHDKDLIITVCSRQGSAISNADESLKGDADLCRRVLDTMTPFIHKSIFDAHPLNWFNKDIVGREMIEHAMKRDPGAVFFVERGRTSQNSPPDIVRELVADRATLLKAIRGRSDMLEFFPQYWKDKEVYLAALATPQRSLEADELPGLEEWDDLEVACAAVGVDRNCISYVAEHLKSSPELIMAMVNSSPDYCDPELLDDIDQDILCQQEVLACLADNRLLENLIGDEEFTKLKDAFANLKDDYDWMKLRIRANAYMWNLASDRLKQNRSLMILAFRSSREIFRQPHDEDYLYPTFEPGMLPKVFYKDQEVIDEAKKADCLYFVPVSELPWNTVLQDISKNGLRHYRENWGDLEKAIAVLEIDPSQMFHLEGQFRTNKSFRSYVQENKYVFWRTWKSYGDMPGPAPNLKDVHDRELALSVLRESPANYKLLKKSFQDNESFAIEAVSLDQDIFQYLPEDLQGNTRVQASIKRSIDF